MAKKAKDSGVRGTSSGRLYIDKKVFFKRDSVQKALRSLRESEVLKRDLSRAAG